MKRLVLLSVVLHFWTPALAYGIRPLDALREPLDEVVRILKDPQFDDEAKKQDQRNRIGAIIHGVFDFREISIRALAKNWKQLTPEQQKEFTEIFSEFLSKTYLDKVQGDCRNEKIVYIEQQMISETKAIVKTRIVRKNNTEVPVEYRMRMRKNSWRIYDVRIEGVSLVKNYRSQFKKILMKETPDQLIDRLKEKVANQENMSFMALDRPGGVFENNKYAWQLLAQRYFLELWFDTGNAAPYGNR